MSLTRMSRMIPMHASHICPLPGIHGRPVAHRPPAAARGSWKRPLSTSRAACISTIKSFVLYHPRSTAVSEIIPGTTETRWHAVKTADSVCVPIAATSCRACSRIRRRGSQYELLERSEHTIWPAEHITSFSCICHDDAARFGPRAALIVNKDDILPPASHVSAKSIGEED